MGKLLAIVDEERVTEIRPLSDEQYQEFRAHAGLLTSAWSHMQLLAIVETNYREFENVIEQILTDYTTDPRGYPANFQTVPTEINRLILNLLGSVRTLLDHSAHRISQAHGENALRKFRRVCSSEYDGHFAYRFMYGLRNYAQHCGLPAGFMSIGSEPIDGDLSRPRRYVTIVFDRDGLLKQPDEWKHDLRQELMSLPARIDVQPYLAEMMDSVRRIAAGALEVALPGAIEGALYVEQLVQSIEGPSGARCIAEYETLPNGKANLHMEAIPSPLAATVLESVRLHSSTSNAEPARDQDRFSHG